VTAIAHPTPAQATGGEGEDQAARFLAGHGLELVARNYRTRLGEIDLIAREGATYSARGVRLRPLPVSKPHPPIWIGGNSKAAIRRAVSRFQGWAPFNTFGTARKRARIAAAARQYLMRFRRVPPCRFDVVCIEGGEPTWIRGAFALDSQG